MSKEIHIAEAEWQVMEQLWKNPMMTIGEIRSALSDTGWSDSTIKTLVRRLVQKGVAGADDSRGQFRYFPRVEEHTCKQKETKNFINRIYNGSVRLLMANLVSDTRLTDAEAEKLMELIEKMDGGEPS